MAKDVNKMRWEVVGTSIQTEDEVEIPFEFTGRKKVRLSVAFNVGRDVAHRMVRLHNQALEQQHG